MSRRIACVYLPELPLQLLLRRHPDWRGMPSAVVDRDHAQGVLVHVNETARNTRILPGMRYGAALSLEAQLRAAPVEAGVVNTAIGNLTRTLHAFTPGVEPASDMPGAFWLDASGLTPLYPSLDGWARRVHTCLTGDGWDASLVVGFTRFGAYVVACALAPCAERTGRSSGEPAPRAGRTGRSSDEPAPRAGRTGRSSDEPAPRAGRTGRSSGEPAPRAGRTGRSSDEPAPCAGRTGRSSDEPAPCAERTGRSSGEPAPRAGRTGRSSGEPHASVVVFPSPAAEAKQVRRVPLERTGIDVRARDRLARLGIHTVGTFIALPAAGIRRRFGEAAAALHRQASGEDDTPIQPLPPCEPVAVSAHIDHPETRLDRLIAVTGKYLHALMRRMNESGQHLADVTITLSFDNGRSVREHLRPASPTPDTPRVLNLVRLRLESLALPAGVVDLHIEATGVPEHTVQSDLFATRPARDLEAAARALARIRADLGEEAVARAVLRDAHLPEARFAFEPVERIPVPAPRGVSLPPRVRRILARPVAFSATRERNAGARIVAHIDEGRIRETHGPFSVSGGWWQREVHREYYYVRTADGRVLWMYYDRRRMGWFLQGEVE